MDQSERWPKLAKLAEQIAEADQVRKSRKLLAKEIGINESALSVISQLLDMPAPPPLEVPRGKYDWNAIFSEHADKTAPHIAALVGCDKSDVRRAALRRGFDLVKGRPGDRWR